METTLKESVSKHSTNEATLPLSTPEKMETAQRSSSALDLRLCLHVSALDLADQMAATQTDHAESALEPSQTQAFSSGADRSGTSETFSLALRERFVHVDEAVAERVLSILAARKLVLAGPFKKKKHFLYLQNAFTRRANFTSPFSLETEAENSSCPNDSAPRHMQQK